MTTKRLPWMIMAILAGVIVIGATAFIGGRLLTPYAFHGVLLQSPKPAADFTLTDHTGRVVSLSSWRGKFVALYFGYTVCPDVCPTSLAELRKTRKLLGKQADQLQVAMITVDPERDTQAVLADYVTHFDPTFIGLIGKPAEIARVASAYGVFYEKVEEKDSALGYLMNHTATIMVIDREGYLRVVFPFGTTAEAMAADLTFLLQR